MNSKQMSIMIRWVWTFPAGGILLSLLPSMPYIGTILIIGGFLGFAVDFIKHDSFSFGSSDTIFSTNGKFRIYRRDISTLSEAREIAEELKSRGIKVKGLQTTDGTYIVAVKES